MHIPLASERDAHFEAICTYLGSPVKTGPLRGAMIEEAINIASTHLPSEDMIYQALFIAETPEIADAIWQVHGVAGFEPLDFFSQNVSHTWQAMRLEPEDAMRLFGYMRQAHMQTFIGDPVEAIYIGILSRTPEILEEVMAHLDPSAETIARALGRSTLPASQPERMTRPVMELAGRSLAAVQEWRSIFQAALRCQSAIDMAVFAKIGVDITACAKEMMSSCSTLYHPFLERASSQHGRLSLMRDLPDTDALLKAPPAFVETMLRDMRFPDTSGNKDAIPCRT